MPPIKGYLTKQRTKQVVRRLIGEPYVGKRLKMRRLDHVLTATDLHPSSILDAGTEDGTFVYWLADRYPGATVTAIDIDTRAIAACEAARPARYAGRVNFRAAHFGELEPDSFDLIAAFDVLEHIRDDHAAVTDLARALRPGATLLVHVPRDRWTTRSGKTYRVADEDAWRINPGHVRHGYDPEQLRRLLTQGGLMVVEMDIWVAKWGTLAHDVYRRLEQPMPLRLLSIPVTDVCAWLDQRRPSPDGNTVFARAVKRGA